MNGEIDPLESRERRLLAVEEAYHACVQAVEAALSGTRRDQYPVFDHLYNLKTALRGGEVRYSLDGYLDAERAAIAQARGNVL